MRIWIALLAAGALLLAGCSAGLPTAGPTSTSTSAPTVAPKTTVATTDEEELDSLWDVYVGALYPEQARPDVTLIRYTSPRELPALKVSCLHEQGFPDVSLTPDNAIAYGVIPEEQMLAFGLANYYCAASYLVDPIYRAPLDDVQLATLYDYFVQEAVPCLEGLGYLVDEPPSKESFVANYGSEAWSPFLEVADLASAAEWTEVNQVCPQWPSGFYGY